ncbi:MAG: hypothetical protein AB1595_00495 [bacterium]
MSYKEGTIKFWIRISLNPTWLKDTLGYSFIDKMVGDAKVKILKTPDMKLYVEHYHPLTYFRTLSYDLNLLDKEKDHHIVLTWSPIDLILYIDGKPVAKIENRLEALVV